MIEQESLPELINFILMLSVKADCPVTVGLNFPRYETPACDNNIKCHMKTYGHILASVYEEIHKEIK